MLGYEDWNEMREAEYGGAACMVPTGTRPRIVARLRELGLTQQAIADTVGVSQFTVNRDLNIEINNEGTALLTNSRGQKRPATYKKRSKPEPTPEEREPRLR